jgi:hypothetical protein
MAALRYMKAIRIRYRHNLEKEIKSADEFSSQDITELDKNEAKANMNMSVRMLKCYRDKVEIQCEKYVLALGDSEENETEMDNIMEVDKSLCDKAMKCVSFLEQLSMNIDTESTRKEKFGENVYPIQGETEIVHDGAESSSNTMYGTFDAKTTRGNGPDGPSGRSTSVKLPKLELKSFFGHKVVGVRDRCECTFHRNTKLTDIEKFSYLQSKLGEEA